VDMSACGIVEDGGELDVLARRASQDGGRVEILV
jgi:hypothetical protein